ncbi:AraC family transcriptional regulator [Enterococcus hirae]|uniref:helix-turn-helix domain-containing protein n=1 Tax=Enterococcus hirae TaxID=1354 RepID=UPI000FF89922|nr:helix-turn-helix domain-containing protein [Enterococcus hirae]EMF0166066.1 AraC family transcriptional regulator [Enterococcus hirae]EMF0174326.1 AraC family transcriptional regulator [Enterococcus hirae]EMF0188603.1 AraC family transcriptional regulator [Enterococcus hirae]EMF0193445.1 AraC family transcriptional regulator [Enterococcus hirae]EMF0217623.1 AraC family transcriptional regulator [Enterococcus hirae]
MVREVATNGKNKQHRQLSKSILSYLFVFLVPFFMVSLIWFHTAKESINQQVVLTAKNQLLQLKYSSENKFLQLDNITQHIPYNTNLSPGRLSHSYYAREGQLSLQQYKLSNDFVEEIYLYYKEKPNTLFSSTGSLSVDNFLQRKINNHSLDKKELLSHLDNDIPTGLTLKKEPNSTQLFYIVPIKDAEMHFYGAAIYSINLSILNKLLNLSNSDGISTNYLIDDSYRILAADTSNNKLTAHLHQPKQIQMILQQDNFYYNHRNYLVQSLNSRDLNMSFVSVMDPSQALTKINTIHQKFLKLFFVIFVFGLVLVVIIGTRFSQPIRNIEKLIDQYYRNKIGVAVSNGNVYETLAQFLNEHEELHKEIKRQTPHAREQVLRKILGGKFKSPEDSLVLLNSVQVHFTGTCYFVVVVDYPIQSIDDTANELPLKVSGKNFSGYGTEILSAGVTAYIFSTYEKTSHKKVVIEMIQQLKKACYGTFRIGVGNSTENLTKINASYIEGLAALDYSTVENNFVFYNEIPGEESSTSINYPDGEKLKLIQSLRQGDLTIAAETIESLIERGIKEHFSYSGQKMYGFYLLNAVAKVSSNLQNKTILKKAEKSAKFSNLLELKQQLLMLAKMICEVMQVKPQNQESVLKKELFEYLHKNYASSQLSMEKLADEFQLSVPYLSRFIKKETGTTFSKYLQELRLEKIKQDLIETDLPIKTIIQKNGYYDVSNYTRKFRTNVGVTPGQYRTMNREGTL